MSSNDCATIREMIPDVAAGRADAAARGVVDSHTAACDECAAELRLARGLAETIPVAPVDLSARVLDAVRNGRRPARRGWWGLSAAAVAALALGIGITSGPVENGTSAGSGEIAIESEEEELWLSEDGILAGAPVLETLSDEALAELLDELTPSTQGGQA